MCKYFPVAVLAVTALIIGVTKFAISEDASPSSDVVRQTMDIAWWTGPMLAPSANTLPRGHFLIEPYVFDVARQGVYDSNGTKRRVPHANDIGSLTYLLYGLANKFSVGLIPTGGYNQPSNGPSSSF